MQRTFRRSLATSHGMKTTAVLLVAALLALLAPAAFGQQDPPGPKHPNVLLILVDDK